MGNLKEKMKTMQRISLDVTANEHIIIQFKARGIFVGERVVCVNELKWTPTSGDHSIEVQIIDVKEDRHTTVREISKPK